MKFKVGDRVKVVLGDYHTNNPETIFSVIDVDRIGLILLESADGISWDEQDFFRLATPIEIACYSLESE